MTKFSIVTITLNGEKYLRQTIESVLSQDYEDIEVVLVDGGSTDGTLDIIKEYASRHSNIRWISEPDKGISDAMNKGITLSTGDVIAHLHSDDYYADSSVISAVSSQFARHRAFWATGGMYIVSNTGEPLTEIKVREYSYTALVRGNILLHPSTFVMREAFDRIGMFDVSLKYAMDYDLWLRVGVLGDPVTIDRPLACFRAHAGSLSTFEALQATKEEWLIRRKFLGRHYLKIFYHYVRYLRSRRCNAKFYDNLISKKNHA